MMQHFVHQLKFFVCCISQAGGGQVVPRKICREAFLVSYSMKEELKNTRLCQMKVGILA